MYLLLISTALCGFVTLTVMVATTTGEKQSTETRGKDRPFGPQRAQSFAERVVFRMLTNGTALGRRFTPVGYMDKCRVKLIAAGNQSREDVDRFLAIRTLTIALSIVFTVLAVMAKARQWSVPGVGAGLTFDSIVLAALFCLAGPDAILNRNADARRARIRRDLPDLVDLLTISVEAGLGFEQAIQHIVASFPGPLTDEFNRMAREMRAGAARNDALSSMGARVDVEEVKSFVLAIQQAEKFGVSIGPVLRAQSEEMRIKRSQMAQETAQKAPVKMLIPIIFFIFPPLFAVVLGPAMLNIATNFK